MKGQFGHGYALLVGVGGGDLEVTQRDADDLYQVLTDPLRAGYPAEQVKLRTGPDATRKDILDGLNWLIGQASQDPAATAILYYSGHGGRIERDGQTEGYFLVPTGYNPEQRVETGLSGTEFTKKIEAVKANKFLVLLDCCHAGGLPAVKADDGSGVKETFVPSPLPPDLAALELGSGQVVVASSYETESSYALQNSRNSVFTACLLEALAGGKHPELDGKVRILPVLEYLFAEVPGRAQPYAQHPFVKKVLNLGEDFVLCYHGGAKVAPGAAGDAGAPLAAKSLLINFQRYALETEREGLMSAWTLRSKKVAMMRDALQVEYHAPIKFQLEYQLLQDEVELAKLTAKIEAVDAKLQS